jgi:hypothetical protein
MNGYVLREGSTRSITDLGRTFLASIEAPASKLAVVASVVPQPFAPAAVDRPHNVIQMEGHKVQRRRAAA